MKLFGSAKELIDKRKNGEKVTILEVVEVVLFQCNLVENQYHQMSEVLYTFTPSKSYAYLLNVKPSGLLFLKTYNTEFDESMIISTDQSGRPLEIKIQLISHCLLINRNDVIFYRTKNKRIC